MDNPAVPGTERVPVATTDSWTRERSSRVAPVSDCVLDTRPCCRLVLGMLDCNRSIARSAAANPVATTASSVVTTERSDETAADSVAAAALDDSDDDEGDDWSRSGSWAGVHRTS